MKKAPSLWTVNEIVKHAMEGPQCGISNVWVPVRPLGLYSLWNRLKLAIGVFIGKYDALKWYKQ